MNTVDLYVNLQTAKEVFIRKLEKGERFGTYLRTENGYDVTAPEGYVAIHNGDMIKLVDRLSFSVANFNVAKNGNRLIINAYILHLVGSILPTVGHEKL